ncbi:LLM class flavin-dependent oxidoreductase [Amycolatopsis sp. GM8]|uniref:LLM class flavin-dependent oxidoreductase n=1 Tax=Amycolatopsis sp. GM8 TaxID=2896530 RepID=UPI001F29F44E|nr:LLM class flavin-dependent oxidoreductase [Amycolatopsis sp. GM8]
MEFGIFIQAPVYESNRRNNPDYEHQSLMNDLEVAIAADRAGFKYVWASEHHFLDEYSHLSANAVMLGYLAHATERAHLGSGIFNPLPAVNHPAKVAETVAMLDHVSGGRFEFGTGRGAGSHEILGFLQDLGMDDLSKTRDIWEDVIAEFPKMWLNDEYPGYRGKYWSLPPRKVLPKPWAKPHPPMWYAAGSTSSYEMAARKGLGVLGFGVASIAELEPVLKTYKKVITEAEPIGAFVNDNIMVTTVASVAEDARAAVEVACLPEMTYQQSLVFRYHDTFPHPDNVPRWPEVLPPLTPDDMPRVREAGRLIGDPDHALAQARRWQAAGCDQLVFSTGWQPKEAILETIRLLGEHVIPKLDTDPVHRTTRFRRRATNSEENEQ